MNSRLEIIAGPNGCGKSTLAEYLIENGHLPNFINADVIAKGLNASNTKGGAIDAGKIMLTEIHQAIKERIDVSFETTLSGRTWIKLIAEAKKNDYSICIHYLIVDNSEIALQRIKKRVALGGHDIPKATVLRRFGRSKALFIKTYSKLCDSWFVYDNSNGNANLIATYENSKSTIINKSLFDNIFK